MADKVQGGDGGGYDDDHDDDEREADVAFLFAIRPLLFRAKDQKRRETPVHNGWQHNLYNIVANTK